ncbi:MAG: DUF2132 domain-containing protein [Deltaproteobacteria bacterium]|nr:DUF2132 domain-containing protein [Deltaproteobacteria bacterium]
MNDSNSNDPLHGITLESILNYLVETVGFPTMGAQIPIRCFTENPSIRSSLKFLRKTPWARKKVEEMYLKMWLGKVSRHAICAFASQIRRHPSC